MRLSLKTGFVRLWVIGSIAWLSIGVWHIQDYWIAISLCLTIFIVACLIILSIIWIIEGFAKADGRIFLRRYQAKKAEKELEESLRHLWESSEIVKTGRESARMNLDGFDTCPHTSWSSFRDSKEGSETLYYMYLHEQYMAYLIEDVRQKLHRLNFLRGKNDPAEWRPGETFPSSHAVIFNRVLYENFLEDAKIVAEHLKESREH